MGQYTSYYLYEKYERRCSGNSDGDCSDWIPSYPNVFSKDGDGSMPLVVRIQNDVDCGWHCMPEYQWVDVPIEEDYICDECDLDIEFRWVSTSAYTYFGDYKYEVQQEQFRKDGGEWQDTQNTRYHNTGIKVGKKIKITMDNGDVFSQSCGTDDGVWHSYHSGGKYYSETAIQHNSNKTEWGDNARFIDFSDSFCSSIDSVELGECVTELGWRYRNTPYKEPCTDPKCIDTGGGGGCGPSYWDNDVSTSGERMKYVYPASFAGMGIKEITLPEGLRWIGGGALANNKFTAVTIPSSVETIGYVRTFDSCRDHGSCMDHTDSYAFGGNYYLEEIHLNNGLKSIGDSDFANCISLTRVDIPSSVERMGSRVFSGCSNLKQIVFHSETPPTSICTDDHWYYTDQCRGEEPNLYVNDDVFVYIPCGSLSAYTNYLSDVPSDRIVEYSGACGSIPSIPSMYRVFFTYKISGTTHTKYRGLLQDSGSTTMGRTTDFTMIDYADEITIPADTFIYPAKIYEPELPRCGKFTLCTNYNGLGSDAYGLYVCCDEFVVDTSAELSFVNTTAKKIVIKQPAKIYDCFNGAESNNQATDITIGTSPFIEEVYIEAGATLMSGGNGATFSYCPGLKDIYISYTGGVVTAEHSVEIGMMDGTYPTVHVPCRLYDAYRYHPIWGDKDRFTIVVDDPECSSGYTPSQPSVELLSNYEYTISAETGSVSGESDSVHEDIIYLVYDKDVTISVNYKKAGGNVNKQLIYVDGVLVYSRGENMSGYGEYWETALALQADGNKHIVMISGNTGSTPTTNKFVITYT